MSASSYTDSSESKENLLQQYSDELDSSMELSKVSFIRKWYLFIMCIALATLSIISISLFVQNRNLQRLRFAGHSRFSGLPYDKPVIYQTQTEWWGNKNESRADELWESLDISPLVVALSDDWAAEHDLEISESRFPWDDEKGLYYLKSFHELHCLKIMRRAWVDIERGNPPIIASHHIHHCLDTLRQDIMCTANDTPMPTRLQENVIGDGQVMMCRDFDKMIKWTQEPERQSCYKRLTDYFPLAHKLERFAFCPQDSKYYSVVESYFKKWGHKDPFVE
ncbi:hypothetical protein ACMFMG_001338 [Clarireedia jacksonii]